MRYVIFYWFWSHQILKQLGMRLWAQLILFKSATSSLRYDLYQRDVIKTINYCHKVSKRNMKRLHCSCYEVLNRYALRWAWIRKSTSRFTAQSCISCICILSMYHYLAIGFRRTKCVKFFHLMISLTSYRWHKDVM